MLCASSCEQISKFLLQILPHATAVASSTFPPIQRFCPLTYLHISMLEKLSVCFPPPFLTVRCNIQPYDSEETLHTVTFSGVPSCLNGDVLNSFWIVPHTSECVAASSIPAVRIICSLVQKGLCSYLIMALVSVLVSQWKQKIEGVLNPMLLICNC